MQLSYYPGCTLKTDGKNFETSALAVLDRLGVSVSELEDWYCCGVCFSQTQDNLMQQVAPVRTLVKAKEKGNPQLLALCTMCFNTLKRSIEFIKNDSEKMDTIHQFMDLENTQFFGDEIDVVDILTLIRQIGLEKLKEAIVKTDAGLKIASYYGCMLLRPKEIAIDSPDDPVILEEILESAGCENVYFPFRTECCGSYQIVNKPNIVKDRAKKIVNSAVKNGADLIVMLCPLCYFNFDEIQLDIKKEDASFQTIPVLYITQLLALLMGLDPHIQDFNLHAIDPRPVLKRKGLL
ncbi:MAG: CoB--CoM heterodisulfide reductase iron-sulfur subunit B family protein [Candidatus Marinimicrobia bacterium]|nr:CoB--CoM heterodisulfide reductase iron-sulfur subunit B family protein [Candidatus Neomarinimicrobiota bacterium]